MVSVEGCLILFSDQSQPMSHLDMHESIICVPMRYMAPRSLFIPVAKIPTVV